MPINMYMSKVYGLIGGERVGKNIIADFLTETRGFEQIAFADQIKEEFGISKEDFEAAKIAGNIGELRNQLWEFSASKKKDDPKYFIKRVIDKAYSCKNSVIITDIRTNDEFKAVIKAEKGATNKVITKVFWVTKSLVDEIDKETQIIKGSKLNTNFIDNYMRDPYFDVSYLLNTPKSGLYGAYRSLDRFFFEVDINDLIKTKTAYKIVQYTQQFRVISKGRNF